MTFGTVSRGPLGAGARARALVLVMALAPWPAAAAAEQPERLDLTAREWREDLAFLARELPKRHGDAFHFVSRERFSAAVADLDRRLDGAGGDAAYVGLDSVANLVGDAHTYVRFPRDDGNLPIDLGRYGGEYRVRSAVPGLERALGARVIGIGDTPIERARELVLPLTPQDETPELREAFASQYLTSGMVLHGLGITPARDRATFRLAGADGQEFELEVREDMAGRGAPIRPFTEPPLYMRNPRQGFWFTYLDSVRTVYCSFRNYRELGANARDLFKLVAERKPDKLVIDMRQNGGGDYTQGLKHLIRPLRALRDVNRRGHLFVLVGTFTFSAAMANAAQFRAETEAILVGQTIGERPNGWQEPREMTLPNSHLTVRFSTREYRFVESGENVVRPDHEIVPTWDDYAAGRDAALEWVLRQPAGAGPEAR